ncbi:hypothetical protein [Senegalimassilia faecalis]|uniref:hypothetical protein n=1 Tax=Senegalimassilia faecalis TaxID=2509433 RepID=UPI003A987FF8
MSDARYCLTQKGNAALNDYPDLREAASNKAVKQAISNARCLKDKMAGSTPVDSIDYLDTTIVRIEVNEGVPFCYADGKAINPHLDASSLFLPNDFTELHLIVNNVPYVFEKASKIDFLGKAKF